MIRRQVYDDLNLSTSALTKEQAVHSRTPISLAFRVELPPCHLGPGWKRRLGTGVRTAALAPKVRRR